MTGFTHSEFNSLQTVEHRYARRKCGENIDSNICLGEASCTPFGPTTDALCDTARKRLDALAQSDRPKIDEDASYEF